MGVKTLSSFHFFFPRFLVIIFDHDNATLITFTPIIRMRESRQYGGYEGIHYGNKQVAIKLSNQMDGIRPLAFVCFFSRKLFTSKVSICRKAASELKLIVGVPLGRQISCKEFCMLASSYAHWLFFLRRMLL